MTTHTTTPPQVAHRVQSRLARSVLANLAGAAILAAFIWLINPDKADAWATLRWLIPVWLAIRVPVDYFVWRTPAKEAARVAARAARRQARRDRHPNIRL